MSTLSPRPATGLLFVAATLIAGASPATADRPAPLTRERVIELARSSSPAVRLASTSVAEGRAQLIGARIFARDNPVVEAAAGPRWADQTSTDVEATLVVPFELGKRQKRIAAAKAGLARSIAATAVDQREAVSRALMAYYHALHADARLHLAEERKRLADQLLAAARSRREAGDIADLEVNVAATEIARAESEVLAEAAEVSRARGALAIELGLEPQQVTVEGSLGDRASFDAVLGRRGGVDRPEVVAARLAVRESRAAVASADAERYPDVNFRMTYAREDGGTDIVLAGVAFSLPLFNRNQGEREVARVRTRRAELQLALTGLAVSSERQVAAAAYRSITDALLQLERGALPLVEQNERLAVTAYQAGKGGLATVLLVRRETLDTRREHIDRQLAVALAGVELARAFGALP